MNCFRMMMMFCLCVMAGAELAARPLSTEEWISAGQGELSLEAGHDVTAGEGDWVSRETLFTLVYGLPGNAELAVDFPWEEARAEDGRTVSGMGDVSLHLKYGLVEGSGLRPGIAVKSSVKLATGKREDGLGYGDEDVGFSLISSFSSGSWSFRLLAGYVFAGNRYDPAREDFMRYGTGIGFEAAAGLTLLAELCGESCDGHSAVRVRRHGLRQLAGAMFEFHRGVSVDAAAYLDFEEKGVASRGFTAGMTFIFDSAGLPERYGTRGGTASDL